MLMIRSSQWRICEKSLDYKVTFKKSVAKDLKKISAENVDRILRKIDSELPGKAESLPMLQGDFAGLRKYRIGNYRVIFSIIDATILILRVQHRKEVYKS